MYNDKDFLDIMDEDELVDCVKQMRHDAEDAISERVKVSRKAWLYLLGNQYLIDEGEAYVDAEMPSWKFRLTRNIVAPVIDTLSPILSQARPKYFVRADFPQLSGVVTDPETGMQIPTGLTDAELAKRLEDILENTHQKRNEGLEISKLLMDVLINGTGYRKIHYCSHTNQVKLPIVPFEDVLIDPMGTRQDLTDSKYVIVRHYMDAVDIKNLYGLDESQYAQGSPDSVYSKSGIKGEGRSWMRRLRNFFNDGNSGQTGSETPMERRRYPVLECYYNGDNGYNEAFHEAQAMGYNANRSRTVVVVNEQAVVYDQPNAYWHGEFPVCCYVANPLPHVVHGRSEAEPLLSVQDGVNILYNTVIANALLMSNSQWLVEDGAVQYEDLTNQPGLIIPVERLDKVERIPPAPVPGDVLNVLKELEGTTRQNTSGISPVLQGQEPYSGASGKLASVLTGNAFSRQSPKIQAMDDGYRRQARLELSLMQQFKRFEDPRETNTYDEGENLLFSEAMRELLYTVEIDSKADSPLNMTDKINYAFAMVQSGVFDVKEFVRYTQIELSEERKAEIFQAVTQAEVLQGQLASTTPMGDLANQVPQMLANQAVGGAEGAQ